MPQHTNHSALALGLALALTFGISIIKGGAPQWVSFSWVSACALALILLIVARGLMSTNSMNADRGSLLAIASNRNHRGVFTPFYLFLAFQLWALVQHIALSPDKPASLDQLLIGAGMSLLLAIWIVAVRHPKALHKLYLCFIGACLIQAAYGLWIYLSDTQLILWMPKLHYLDRPSGFFVNANHFAAYLMLGIILCVARLLTSKRATNTQNTVLRYLEHLYNPSNAILCLLVLSVLASRSFGAIAALGFVFTLICSRAIWQSQQRAFLLCLCGGLFVVLVAMILSMDYSTIESEFTGLSHTFTRRWELSLAALSMLQDNWLTGVGGGAFYSQFSQFRTLEIGNSYYNYAHNDLLQFCIEYGLIGCVILLLFVTTVMRDNIRVLTRTPTGTRATFACASIYATIAVAIHSLVDFPLHIPGFSVGFLILISINSMLLLSKSLRDHG